MQGHECRRSRGARDGGVGGYPCRGERCSSRPRQSSVVSGFRRSLPSGWCCLPCSTPSCPPPSFCSFVRPTPAASPPPLSCPHPAPPQPPSSPHQPAIHPSLSTCGLTRWGVPATRPAAPMSGSPAPGAAARVPVPGADARHAVDGAYGDTAGSGGGGRRGTPTTVRPRAGGAGGAPRRGRRERRGRVDGRGGGGAAAAPPRAAVRCGRCAPPRPTARGRRAQRPRPRPAPHPWTGAPRSPGLRLGGCPASTRCGRLRAHRASP